LKKSGTPVIAFCSTNISAQWPKLVADSAQSTGSKDVGVTTLSGCGHLDVLCGTGSESLVFKPILDWLRQHQTLTQPTPAAQVPRLLPNSPLTVFVFPDEKFLGFDENALREHFLEIRQLVGNKGKWGSVGLAFNYPYTAFLGGSGPDHFELDKKRLQQYERATRIAHELSMPVLVGLNGAVWASSDGPFNAYWKTVKGGKYLSRYADARVNQSCLDTAKYLPQEELRKYLPVDAGNPDYLTLTESSSASDLQSSRLSVLRMSLQFWRKLVDSYPNTIVAFTTDSEVSFSSFRRNVGGKPMQIGYEDFIRIPFCQKEHIGANKLDTLLNKESSPVRQRWHLFRSHLVQEFVAASVSEIRAALPGLPIYTHQIACLSDEYSREGYDSDAPMETAIIPGATPGYTIYIWSHRDQFLRQFLDQLEIKLDGKDWEGSKDELRLYTRQVLSKLYHAGARAVAPLAWLPSKLDGGNVGNSGIKDSGVDQGIKDFLELGPSE
jgi:hypothetical protein